MKTAISLYLGQIVIYTCMNSTSHQGINSKGNWKKKKTLKEKQRGEVRGLENIVGAVVLNEWIIKLCFSKFLRFILTLFWRLRAHLLASLFGSHFKSTHRTLHRRGLAKFWNCHFWLRARPITSAISFFVEF